MAQLVLTAASNAAANIGKIGIGKALARTAASTAASFAASAATNALFGPRRRAVEGPRLESYSLQASTEGAGLARVWGRARLAGQLIWAARFKETVVETSENVGGKGGPSTRVETTNYQYAASFAVGLCEGPIDRVARVWADGRAFDLSRVNARVYTGDEAQGPDALIAAVEGAAPAFRGLAYVVFEDLPLEEFGNRLPQLAFEVEKSLRADDPGALENALTAVTMIPGSGEFVYGTTQVLREAGEGVTVSENAHNSGGGTDFVASLDALLAAAPNVKSVSLVVSWFGDATDAGACEIRPGVETGVKLTRPYDWRAGGVDRSGARLISTLNGAPAYGGAPADRAVVEAIREMADRGLEVMMHPFVLMDAAGFPWRGRIAPGPDVAGDVARFFGTAGPGDFSPNADDVDYHGADEWSFRRFVLHCAHLCALAGGVEAFLLGSELRGLTTARDGAGAYPAVGALKALAADVRAILGPATKISYGADWSEWFGHQPGGGDVAFHLDPLWSDPNIDFIGVDNYLPLADWRDGPGHLDADAAGPRDVAYLRANIRGGERYDWFYASAADRDAQIRTEIADGAHGEPWVYRPKDFWSWWANPHHERVGGVRSATPTAWTPMSKPIRFTEIGCPAVDKGANQPNVFVDPKSDESALPHHSSGARDDLAQRRFLEAHLGFWREAGDNPVSSVYGGPMVDAERLYAYAWDARPYPFFPGRDDVWGDGANWARGHWLTGRLARAPLDVLIAALAREAGDVSVETAGLDGAVTGYVVDRPMSAREMIDPLADVYQIDMVETVGALRFQSRAQAPAFAIDEGDLARDGDEPAFAARLAQADDLPNAARIGYLDENADYAPAVAHALIPGETALGGAAAVETAAVMGAGEAAARAAALLADANAMRESVRFALPPARLALEPGDVVDARLGGVARRYRVTEISNGVFARVEAVRLAPSAHDAPRLDGGEDAAPPSSAPVFGPPAFELLDLPLLRDTDDPSTFRFAAFADPWPGGVSLYREPGPEGAPVFVGAAPARGVLGRLVEALAPGASGRWMRQSLRVAIGYGGFASRAEAEVFAGANALAVETTPGVWEVAQFRDATLEAPGVWRLSHLLRGQAGGEAEAALGAPAGARVVALTPAVGRLSPGVDARDLDVAWRAGPRGAPPPDAAFARRVIALTGRGLKPLSPVRLRAAPLGPSRADGWRFAWIRRTRVGGDGWAGETTPLGEAFERYRVEILADGAVVRVAEVEAPGWDYGADAVAADFGPAGPPPAVTARVAQLSDAVGPGAAVEIGV
ncbi:MAG: glycoside hydrolase TIM-barrel-like domain-containing protein [Parvularculaceae bacterium]